MKWTFDYPETISRPCGKYAEGPGGAELTIRLDGPAGIGFWSAEFPFHGQACRIQVDSDAGAALAEYAGAIAHFRQADGQEASIDYLEPFVDENGLLYFCSQYDLPDDIATVKLRLFLKWRQGQITFRNITVEPCEPAGVRPVKIITTRLESRAGETYRERLSRIDHLLTRIEQQVKNPDLVLLTEVVDSLGLTPPPQIYPAGTGPAAQMLSGHARKLHCYIAAGLYEQDNGVIYNSAQIWDRNGQLVGKYRKVHLTLTESARGIMPGDQYPVFQLDKMRVGIAICWDNWFPETARELRLNGAEIMLVPIAGDGIPGHRDHVWAARAAENGLFAVFAVSHCSEDGLGASRIIDPFGVTLAEATGDDDFAEAVIDLNRRYRTRYLSVGNSMGEGRSLYLRERRPATYRH